MRTVGRPRGYNRDRNRGPQLTTSETLSEGKLATAGRLLQPNRYGSNVFFAVWCTGSISSPGGCCLGLVELIQSLRLHQFQWRLGQVLASVGCLEGAERLCGLLFDRWVLRSNVCLWKACGMRHLHVLCETGCNKLYYVFPTRCFFFLRFLARVIQTLLFAGSRSVALHVEIHFPKLYLSSDYWFSFFLSSYASAGGECWKSF